MREWGALGCTLLGVALAVGGGPPGMRAEGKPP
jgi:hypothetical protein